LFLKNQLFASPLNEALQQIGGNLEEETLLILFLISEKARGEASPWHAFLHDLRPKGEAPGTNRRRRRRKKTTSAVSERKRKTMSLSRESQSLKENESINVAQATQTKPPDGKEEGNWSSEIDLPLIWNEEERGLLGSDFDAISGLRLVGA